VPTTVGTGGWPGIDGVIGGSNGGDIVESANGEMNVGSGIVGVSAESELWGVDREPAIGGVVVGVPGVSWMCSVGAKVPEESGTDGVGGNGGIKVELERRDDSNVLACSKALAKASTFVKRRCGSFLSAVNTTSSTADATPDIFARNGRGEANIC
jgi:hypothetical protein